MALLSHSHGAQPQDGTSGQWITVEIDAMVSIAKEVETDPQMVKNAPYGTRTSKVDEVTAARKPVLKWKPA